jgi:hypothetical protein
MNKFYFFYLFSLTYSFYRLQQILAYALLRDFVKFQTKVNKKTNVWYISEF